VHNELTLGRVTFDTCDLFRINFTCIWLISHDSRILAGFRRKTNRDTTATHCNTLQHTATHCNTLHSRPNNRWHISDATHCNTLQHTATHCNTLTIVGIFQTQDEVNRCSLKVYIAWSGTDRFDTPLESSNMMFSKVSFCQCTATRCNTGRNRRLHK